MMKRKTDDAVILKMHEEGKSLREITVWKLSYAKLAGKYFSIFTIWING